MDTLTQSLNDRNAQAKALTHQFLDLPDEEAQAMFFAELDKVLLPQFEAWKQEYVNAFLQRFRPEVGGIFAKDSTVESFFFMMTSLKLKVTK